MKAARWLLVGGLLAIVLGFFLAVNGDQKASVAKVDLEYSSSATWGNLLGFDSGQDLDYANAAGDLEAAQQQSTFGSVLMGAGAIALVAGFVASASARRKEAPVPAAAGARAGSGTAAGTVPGTVVLAKAAAPATAGGSGTDEPPAAATAGPDAVVGERRPCPTCGESIAQAAKLCRFCGREVPAAALP